MQECMNHDKEQEMTESVVLYILGVMLCWWKFIS